MLQIISAIAPVFLVLGLGAYLKAKFFPDRQFWDPLEQINYYLLFPAFLFVSIAKAPLAEMFTGRLPVALVAFIIIFAALLFILQSTLNMPDSAYASVFQGAIRINTYIGFTMAMALKGQEGYLTYAAICAISLPLLNLLSIGALIYSSPNRSGTSMVKEFIKNPIVIGCISGLLFNLSHLEIPTPLWEGIKILSQAALGIGLLIVGAALDLDHIRQIKITDLKTNLSLYLATSCKLFVAPIIMTIICSLVGVQGNIAFMLILFSSLPGAPAAYALTLKMGGDAVLLANIIALETLLSCFSMPMVIYIMS